MSPWEQLEPHSSTAVHSSLRGFCSSEEVLLSHRLTQAHALNQYMVSKAYFLY